MSTGGVRWDRVTALFGGTFDPPHLGHREAVEHLFRLPGVRRVRVIPSGLPPWKAVGATSAEHRLEMARLAFRGLPDVTLDARELDRAARTSAPTYTYDTLLELRAELGTELAFVIGTDQLLSLSAWHRFPELLGLCHWLVLERSGVPTGQARQLIQDWEGSGLLRRQASGEWQVRAPQTGISVMTHLAIAPTPARSVSSTQVREALGRSGQVPPEVLDPLVEAYLKAQGLYGTGKPS